MAGIALPAEAAKSIGWRDWLDEAAQHYKDPYRNLQRGQPSGTPVVNCEGRIIVTLEGFDPDDMLL